MVADTDTATPHRLKHLATSTEAFCSDSQGFAVVFYLDLLERLEILFDIRPFKVMAIFLKPSAQLFSKYQNQEAEEHMAIDSLIPLV
jgi:hypothetical protein